MEAATSSRSTRIHHVDSLAQARDLAARLDRSADPYLLVLPRFDRRPKRPEWIVSDACKTLINGAQFDAMRAALPPELAAVDRSFLELLSSPAASDPVRAAEAEGAWIAADVHLLAGAGFDQPGLLALGASLPLRPGTADLLGLFDRPRRAIVSFGLKPLVVGCLAAHDLDAEVYAADIVYDGNRILCADPRTMVTSGTKGAAMDDFLARTGCTDLRLVLAVGDDPRVDRALWRDATVNVLMRQAEGVARFDRLTSQDSTRISLVASDPDTLATFLASQR